MEEEWADGGGALIPGIDVKVRVEPHPVANGNNLIDQVCAYFVLRLHNVVSFQYFLFAKTL